jgi:hypothetical protein
VIGNAGSPASEKSPALAPPMTTLVIVRLQVPVFETTNGLAD